MQKHIDWETLVLTIVSALGSAGVFVGLYAALTLPVAETLQRF